jgi:hypothetical protein
VSSCNRNDFTIIPPKLPPILGLERSEGVMIEVAFSPWISWGRIVYLADGGSDVTLLDIKIEIEGFYACTSRIDCIYTKEVSP